MGNCTGFCMSSTPEENIKKVTTDKVKSALYEKDEMMREQAYEDDFKHGNNGNSGPRKL